MVSAGNESVADQPVQLAGLLRLDRASPVPLYYQVAQGLSSAIRDGRLPAGTRLDNEILLAEQLGLSRPTLRRALQDLTDSGLLVRRRGVGTRVVRPRDRPLGLSRLLDGPALATAVLDLRSEPVSGTLAATLGLVPGDLATVLVRLASADGAPLGRLVSYLPPGVPGLARLTRADLEKHGLHGVLRRLGVQVHSADQSIGARTATAEEARLLGEARGAALLTVTRTTYDDRGQVVEVSSQVFAASRYTVDFSMLAS